MSMTCERGFLIAGNLGVTLIFIVTDVEEAHPNIIPCYAIDAGLTVYYCMRWEDPVPLLLSDRDGISPFRLFLK